MRGINRVFLMGNVGQDPVVRHTPNGRVVCDLSVATHRGVRSAGDTWTEEVEWTQIRAWEQKAEILLRYVTRGSGIAVEGSLRNETWTDKEGVRRQRSYVQVDHLHLLPTRPRDEGARDGSPRDEGSRDEGSRDEDGPGELARHRAAEDSESIPF